MPVLEVHAGATSVTVRTGDAAATRGVPVDRSRPGCDEVAPEALWLAVLSAVTEVVASGPAPDAVRVGGEPSTLVVWDQETLGSPIPAIGPADRRADDVCGRLAATALGRRVREVTGRPLDASAAAVRLVWLREHAPNVWALVEEGRYVVGPPASYLVSRMTRGVWHLVDRAGAEATLLLDPGTGSWSAELCTAFGVPVEVLPDVVGGRQLPARTDRTVCAGLDVPVSVV